MLSGKRKIEIRDEVFILDILSLILILIIAFTNLKVVRIILGLPFILFFPGYALISALFVKRGELEPVARIALSFGLSIAVVPLIGLVLNYTPFGIRLYPVLFSLLTFIMVMSCITYYRRRKVPEEERFRISIELDFPSWEGDSKIDKILTIILLSAIIIAVGTLIYVIVTPKVGERFTEFYILGPSGKAEGYPRTLKLGEDGKVILGVVNREYQDVEYRVEIKIKDKTLNEIGPIKLSHEEKWEGLVVFSPEERGKDIKVEFILYRLDKPEVYRSLHLWIDVI